MSFDINFLRNVLTIAAMVAFAGVLWWAYAPKRETRFKRDALSIFEDHHHAMPLNGFKQDPQ